MPVYSYECDACGGEFDRFLSLANYRVPQKCVCGVLAKRVIKPTSIAVDYPGYTCPVSGEWVDGKRAHEANLKKHNCRVLEPGETAAATHSSRKSDEDFAERIADTAASIVENLPAAKREQLGRELSNGADIAVERL